MELRAGPSQDALQQLTVLEVCSVPVNEAPCFRWGKASSNMYSTVRPQAACTGLEARLEPFLAYTPRELDAYVRILCLGQRRSSSVLSR